MSLQPAVTPFPHRDNGSVVAHGLAMSVNGQDPRANVYLLDGTLLNDFTNGPAGSAAGTALGMETVREFRVESNTYSAEFGRNVGGQINVDHASPGTNRARRQRLRVPPQRRARRAQLLRRRREARLHAQPVRRRRLAGRLRRDRLFFFVGYEALRENLGRTIVTTVPDDNARLGLLPTGPVADRSGRPAVPRRVSARQRREPRRRPGTLHVSVRSAARPELLPGAGRRRAAGRRAALRPLHVRRHRSAAADRLSRSFRARSFPRNQFLTGEYRKAFGASVHTARFGYSRTRIGQNVEANTSQPLPVFVPGRDSMGAIDIGGVPRFGPQSSANLRLRQDVVSGQYDVAQARGRHLLKAGALVEHYARRRAQPDVQPGDLPFRESLDFPAERAGAVHRPHAAGRLHAALGLDALRLLRAGRLRGVAAT